MLNKNLLPLVKFFEDNVEKEQSSRDAYTDTLLVSISVETLIFEFDNREMDIFSGVFKFNSFFIFQNLSVYISGLGIYYVITFVLQIYLPFSEYLLLLNYLKSYHRAS